MFHITSHTHSKTLSMVHTLLFYIYKVVLDRTSNAYVNKRMQVKYVLSIVFIFVYCRTVDVGKHCMELAYGS